jgi:threonine dehydratase
VMPEPTPFVKVSRTRLLGATVELHGETLGDAMTRGEQLVAEHGLTFVHPFDDPDVVAGAGTVALELLADHPDLDVLLVPVGGGGLLAGMSVVARDLCPHVELVGVQTGAYPSMQRALAGDPTPVEGGPTLAEGIAVGEAGGLAARLLADAGARIVTVSERAIEEGINLLLEIEKVVAEGAGAAALAALLEYPDRFRGRRVGLVLSGGNIDLQLLASVIMRSLVRTGRLLTIRVAVPDIPGALGRLTAAVGAAGGNIIDVLHRRYILQMPSRAAQLDLTVEVASEEAADALLKAIADAGFDAEPGPHAFG